MPIPRRAPHFFRLCFAALVPVAFCIAVGADSQASRVDGTSTQSSDSTSADYYLHYALTLMKKNALHRKEIDWQALNDAAISIAKGAQTSEDTYPAIAYVCAHLRDHSSHLQMPAQTTASIQQRVFAIMATLKNSQRKTLMGRERSPFTGIKSFKLVLLKYQQRTYAYLVIPESNSLHVDYSNADVRHRWSEELIRLITTAKEHGADGWILDVRGNTGGYLAPMLAGVSCFLGDGKILEMRGPDGKTEWTIQGSSIINRMGFRRSVPVAWIGEPLLDERRAPVAILTDRGTEAAAESFVIAFLGRERTQVIGERTAGLTATGEFWTLSDGATLSIMSQLVYDRYGKAYPEGVEPTIDIEEPSVVPALSKDPAILAAEKWLTDSCGHPQ